VTRRFDGVHARNLVYVLGQRWFTGAAGPFNVEAWADSKCNTYYRVKLAQKLAVSNQYVSWRKPGGGGTRVYG
jgi:hypothetical protein